MTNKYQKEIIKYLFTHDGMVFIDKIDSDLFDLTDDKLVYELLVSYVKEYLVVPTEIAFKEYIHRVSNKMKPSVLESIVRKIAEIYREDVTVPEQMLEKDLVNYAKTKMMKNTIKDFSSDINNTETYEEFKLKIDSIVNFTPEQEKEKVEFILDDDIENNLGDMVEPTPLLFDGINKLTTYGGFSSPELIIFMSEAKRGKTTILLNLAKGLLLRGKKVLFIDFENGASRIKRRLLQSMLKITGDKLLPNNIHNVSDKLSNIRKYYRMMGGDIAIKYYPAHTTCMNDIERDVIHMRDYENFDVEVLICDYPDLMAANDWTKRKEKRINIQHVYHDIVAFNSKYGCFTLAPSQINGEGAKRVTLKARDVDEDSGKIKNAHAVFSINQTPEEEEANIVRISPAVQREGASTGTVWINLDKSTAFAEEIPKEEIEKIIEDY